MYFICEYIIQLHGIFSGTLCHRATISVRDEHLLRLGLYRPNRDPHSEHQQGFRHERTEAHSISISKSSVLSNLLKYDIFRLNYMNIISNRAQSINSRRWAESTDNLEKRIGNFILTHIERPSGRKILKIKMEELAQVVNDTRMGVSRALNSMQEKGLLELHRGEMMIPDAEKLL